MLEIFQVVLLQNLSPWCLLCLFCYIKESLSTCYFLPMQVLKHCNQVTSNLLFDNLNRLSTLNLLL